MPQRNFSGKDENKTKSPPSVSGPTYPRKNKRKKTEKQNKKPDERKYDSTPLSPVLFLHFCFFECIFEMRKTKNKKTLSL